MTEKDVMLMTKSDMTVKIPLWELNKSQLDFQNGLLAYLSACSGQKNYNYQVNRMEKWNN